MAPARTTPSKRARTAGRLARVAELSPDAELPFHRFANCFPMMSEAEAAEHRGSLADNGLREPIVLYRGAILDGRNRYLNGRAAGVALRYRLFGSEPGDGADALAFVIDKNLKRRHLKPGQLASVVADIEQLRRQGRPAEGETGKTTRGEALALVGHAVSERTVAHAAVVRDRGSEGLREAVKQGAVAPSVAAEVAAALVADDQDKLVALGEKAILKAASEIRAKKTAGRREQIFKRNATISACNVELKGEALFPVIYADPPWRYENPHMGTTGRSIEKHYPTMSLAEICAVPVKQLATPDAVLFMWITVPHTYCSGPAVLDAWGFEFKSEIVWDKVVPGTGYWSRGQHEKVLICRRGKMPDLHGDRCPPSVYRERRTEHSAKPEHFYTLIERAYPEYLRLPPAAPLMIELFRRGENADGSPRPPRPGWAAWGNQAQARAAA